MDDKTELCSLFGAYQALGGIKENITLFHSLVGCNFGALNFHLPGHMSDIRQASTVFRDKDVIFNGEDSLDLAIRNIRELYNPGLITVISGCISALIGDDIKSVIERYGEHCPIIYFEGAGFKGNFAEGYEEALLGAAKRIVTEVEKSEVPSINLLGLNYDDFKLNADLKELERILRGKIKINCVTAACSLKEFAGLARANLNIVFKRGEKTAEFLKKSYGMDYIEADYPYGLIGMENFLDKVGDFFAIDFKAEKVEIKKATVEGLRPVYSYLKSFYGLPVLVRGEKARAYGLKNFLEEDLGMDVYSQVNEDIALVFGSSFDGKIADKLQIPLIRYEYPVFDRVAISDSPYVSGKGVINMVEDILHTVVSGRTNKGALYNETNMYLW